MHAVSATATWGSICSTGLPPSCKESTIGKINAADDERNPPETGLTEGALKQLKNARLVLIPASEDTRGHGTTGMAKFYRQPLGELLQGDPMAKK